MCPVGKSWRCDGTQKSRAVKVKRLLKISANSQVAATHSLHQVWCQALTSVANGLTCHPSTYPWNWIKPSRKNSSHHFNSQQNTTHIKLGGQNCRLHPWKPYKFNITSSISLFLKAFQPPSHWTFYRPPCHLCLQLQRLTSFLYSFHFSLAVLFSRIIQLLLPFT